MGGLSLKTLTRRFYRLAMNCLVSSLEEADLKGPAIVFAPHPDDETLGCGGTIIKMRRTGASVQIVFMADGSYTPHDLVSADELRSTRFREALAASRLLGVEASDVTFLGFEDGKLNENLDPAAESVVEILARQQPRSVFVPYRQDRDPLSDHLAANTIVVSALRVLGHRVTVYEYPIWFWHRFWPWTGRLKTPRLLVKSLSSGWSLLRDLRHSVYTADVLKLKRAALDQHRSQMTRLVPDPRWPILGDVSDGEFLECFFQEYELLYRYRLPR